MDAETLKEVARLIGEGQSWDALELMRREASDSDLRQAIELAQFKVEIPW